MGYNPFNDLCDRSENKTQCRKGKLIVVVGAVGGSVVVVGVVGMDVIMVLGAC